MSIIKGIVKVLVCLIFYGVFYWLTWLYGEDILDRRDPASDFFDCYWIIFFDFYNNEKNGDPYVIKHRREELDKFIRSLKIL